MARTICNDRAVRHLRHRIGRLRRRVDRRIRRVEGAGRRMVSWRTYVRRHPGHAVLLALGLGMAVSAGLRRVNWAGWLGGQVFRRLVDEVSRVFKGELRRIWASSEPDRGPGSAGGGDDGGA